MNHYQNESRVLKTLGELNTRLLEFLPIGIPGYALPVLSTCKLQGPSRWV